MLGGRQKKNHLIVVLKELTTRSSLCKINLTYEWKQKDRGNELLELEGDIGGKSPNANS